MALLSLIKIFLQATRVFLCTRVELANYNVVRNARKTKHHKRLDTSARSCSKLLPPGKYTDFGPYLRSSKATQTFRSGVVD